MLPCLVVSCCGGYLFTGHPIYDDGFILLQPILKHVEVVMCGGKLVIFDYTLDYFAHAVQYPHIKPGTCIIFYGPQGCGKQLFLCVLLGQGVFGHERFIQVRVGP